MRFRSISRTAFAVPQGLESPSRSDCLFARFCFAFKLERVVMPFFPRIPQQTTPLSAFDWAGLVSAPFFPFQPLGFIYFFLFPASASALPCVKSRHNHPPLSNECVFFFISFNEFVMILAIIHSFPRQTSSICDRSPQSSSAPNSRLCLLRFLKPFFFQLSSFIVFVQLFTKLASRQPRSDPALTLAPSFFA